MHVNTLRSEIERYGRERRFFTRRFEPEHGAIVCRISDGIEVPYEWGLIVGDAVHNFRCALDHLAWQLAVRHCGGNDPPNPRQIQFPVVEDKTKWPGHPHRMYMSDADADILEKFQPFNFTPAAHTLHQFREFAGLAGVSNIDKHRMVQLTFMVVVGGKIGNTSSPVDCVPAVDARGNARVIFTGVSQLPKPGDEVWRVTVVRTGPNPDYDLDTTLDWFVALRQGWNVIEGLDAFAKWVGRVLELFTPPKP